jgi:small-conductance mechanosensitive channel
MVMLKSVADFVISNIFPLLNNIVIAVFTIFIGLIIGRIVGKLASRVLHAFDVDKTLFKMMGANVSVEGLFELIASYLVYLVFLIFALNFLGVTYWIIYAVGIVICVVVAIAAILSLRDFLPNVIAGIILSRRGFPHVGDRIRIDSCEGKVVRFNPIETRIKTVDGDLIAFPNRRLLRGNVEKLKAK